MGIIATDDHIAIVIKIAIEEIIDVIIAASTMALELISVITIIALVLFDYCCCSYSPRRE